jgi:hypothetical protein
MAEGEGPLQFELREVLRRGTPPGGTPVPGAHAKAFLIPLTRLGRSVAPQSSDQSMARAFLRSEGTRPRKTSIKNLIGPELIKAFHLRSTTAERGYQSVA